MSRILHNPAEKGIRTPDYVDGRPLRPLLEGKTPTA